MNAGAVIGVVVVLLVLAVGVFVVTARRHDSRRGEGALSRETRKRDRGPDPRGDRGPAGADRPGGRAGGGGAPSARRSSRRPHRSAPVPYVPPDPETIGVTRRQFFNRGLVALTSAGLAGFGAAVVELPVERAQGRLRRQDQRRQARRPDRRDRAEQGLLLRARGPHVGDGVPGRRPAQGREGLRRRPLLVGMKAGINTLYQKCPHLGLPGAELRLVAVVRVPVPRQPVQPGRREARWPGAARHGPLPVTISGGEVTVDTGHDLPRAGHRHQHHRPGGRGSALRDGWGVTT